MLYKLILSLAEINPQTHTHTKRGEREHTPNQPGDTKLSQLFFPQSEECHKASKKTEP